MQNKIVQNSQCIQICITVAPDTMILISRPHYLSYPIYPPLMRKFSRFLTLMIVSVFLLSSIGSALAVCTQTSGEVAWWPGDGNANDISGNNINGVLVNATFGPGKVGQGFDLSGNGNYVDFGFNNVSLFNQPITIEAWINRNQFSFNTATIAGRREITGSGSPFFLSKGWDFGVRSDGQLEYTYSVSSSAELHVRTINTGLVPEGEFVHVAVTKTGSSAGGVKFYVNGVEHFGIDEIRVLDDTLGSQPNLSSIPLLVGAIGQGSSHVRFANGTIDEVGIYNRVLSISEIQAIHGAGADGKCKVAACGDGIRQPLGADGIAGTADDEDCDGTDLGGESCKFDGPASCKIDCTYETSQCNCEVTAVASAFSMASILAEHTSGTLENESCNECGDGIQDCGPDEECGTPDDIEECDDGFEDPSDTFFTVNSADDDGDCVIDPDQLVECQNNFCGDGYRDANGIDNSLGSADDEVCDDGTVGDQFFVDLMTPQVDAGNCVIDFDRNVPSGLCKPNVCGDGYRDADGLNDFPGDSDDEECDDGNSENIDGCTNDCKIDVDMDGVAENGDPPDNCNPSISHTCNPLQGGAIQNCRNGEVGDTCTAASVFDCVQLDDNDNDPGNGDDVGNRCDLCPGTDRVADGGTDSSEFNPHSGCTALQLDEDADGVCFPRVGLQNLLINFAAKRGDGSFLCTHTLGNEGFEFDNCPTDPNPDQENFDRANGPCTTCETFDKIGDACDPDSDNDGLCDEGKSGPSCTGVDPCPHVVGQECNGNTIVIGGGTGTITIDNGVIVDVGENTELGGTEYADDVKVTDVDTTNDGPNPNTIESVVPELAGIVVLATAGDIVVDRDAYVNNGIALGLTRISGIVDDPSATMTLFVQQLASTDEVCVNVGPGVTNVGFNCNAPTETRVACPGTAGGFTCGVDTGDNQYFVSGLPETSNVVIAETLPFIDADDDGIPDDEDLCSGTSAGDPVDSDGCSDAQVDPDGDGVCDPGAASAGPSGCTGTATGGPTVLFQFDGLAAGDQLGFSVSGAGDVNGDTVPDLIVGAKNAAPGGVPAAGSAFVFSGADGSQLFRFDGSAQTEFMGFSVSGAGDVNGDGKDDVAEILKSLYQELQ